MCQLTPFMLTCCKRIYVDVERLPSCPADWPRRKCPADLCIRVHAFKPEKRKGDCWRCQADKDGLDEEAKERQRPAFDYAEVVLGFEEITPSERRAMTQDDGKCWFCCSTGGCQSCGAKKIGSYEPEQTIEPDVVASPKPTSSTKRKRADSAYDVKKSKQRGVKKAEFVEPKKEQLANITPKSYFTRSKAAQGFPPPLPQLVEPLIDPLLTQSGACEDRTYPSTPSFYTDFSYPDTPTALPGNWLSPLQEGASNPRSPISQHLPSTNQHGPPGYNNSPLIHNYDTTPRTRPRNTFSPLQANSSEPKDLGPQRTGTRGAENQFLQPEHNNFSPAGYNSYSSKRTNMFSPPSRRQIKHRGMTDLASDAAVNFSPPGGYHVEQPAFNLNDLVSNYNVGSFNDQESFNEQPSAPHPSDPNTASAAGRYLTPELPDFNPFEGFLLPDEEEESGNPPFGHYSPLLGSTPHSNQPYNGS